MNKEFEDKIIELVTEIKNLLRREEIRALKFEETSKRMAKLMKNIDERENPSDE